MKFVFYKSDKPFERLVAKALQKGIPEEHEFEIRSSSEYVLPTEGTDVVIVLGVKGHSKKIIKDHVVCGMQYIYIDKGYIRARNNDGIPTYFRLSVDGFQPLDYFQKTKRPGDRWDKFKIKLLPFKNVSKAPILYAGSSQKYSAFHRLGDATDYAKQVIRRLRKYTKRSFVYRPKPSWRDAVPIEDTRFSRHPDKMDGELKAAYILVTHGSNCGYDAIIAGRPVMVLGDGIAKPLSRTDITDIENPYIYTEDERRQWLSDLAYCQWTLPEMESGEAWSHLLKILKE